MKKLLSLFCLFITGCTAGLTNTPGMELYQTGQYEEAQDLLQKEISEGTVQSNYALGLMYLDGQGVDQDLLKAETMLLDGAMIGDHRAVKGLIRFYKENTRCETDQVLAKNWSSQSIMRRNFVTSKIEIHLATSREQQTMAQLYGTPCPNAPYFEKVQRQFDAWSRMPKKVYIYVP